MSFFVSVSFEEDKLESRVEGAFGAVYALERDLAAIMGRVNDLGAHHDNVVEIAWSFGRQEEAERAVAELEKFKKDRGFELSIDLHGEGNDIQNTHCGDPKHKRINGGCLDHSGLVDEGIVDLVLELWKREIAVFDSCQGGPGDPAHLAFSDSTDMEKTLRLLKDGAMQIGTKPAGELLERVVNREWEWVMVPYMAEDDDGSHLLTTYHVGFDYKDIKIALECIRAVGASSAPKQNLMLVN